MKSRFKFRAWNVTTGSFVRLFEPHTFYLNFKGYIQQFNADKRCDCWSHGTFVVRDPNKIIIMQYTGVKDSNGKEIYEGDIIKVPPHETMIKTEMIDQVVFEGCEFKASMEGEDLIHLSHCEVIGNIYENPELLK